MRLIGTGDGKGVVFVAYDGQVFPSGFLPVSLGNVQEGSLQKIYTSHPFLVSLRDASNLKGKCGACEYKNICGGSRSRAYAEYQDPLAGDPACPYIPA